MIPAKFGYHRPGSLDEAIALVRQYAGEAKLLAGGHSLLPMMKLRLARPAALIDLARIPGLAGVELNGDGLRIGAMTLHRIVAEDERIARLAPALHEAANVLGDVQVRNRGTIGGACAHGDPAADYPAIMLALDATFETYRNGETRMVSADDFFLGMFATALDEDEILTAIHLKPAPQSAYEKFAHPASGYAVVGAAVSVALSHGLIIEARVAVTGVADAHVRLPAVEHRLRGCRRDDIPALTEACAHAAAGISGSGDAFASAAYRAGIADTIVERALMSALKKA